MESDEKSMWAHTQTNGQLDLPRTQVKMEDPRNGTVNQTHWECGTHKCQSLRKKFVSMLTACTSTYCQNNRDQAIKYIWGVVLVSRPTLSPQLQGLKEKAAHHSSSISFRHTVASRSLKSWWVSLDFQAQWTTHNNSVLGMQKRNSSTKTWTCSMR